MREFTAHNNQSGPNSNLCQPLIIDNTLQKHSYVDFNHIFIAPIASVVVKKLGCRIAQICGGIFLIVGTGLCAVATEPWHVYILFSGITGEYFSF